MRADQRFGIIGNLRELGALDTGDGQTRIAGDHERRQLFEEQPQTRFTFAQLHFHQRTGPAQFGVAQSPLRRGPEALEIVLKDVVIGAEADRFDRGLLADRTRNDQAGDIRVVRTE